MSRHLDSDLNPVLAAASCTLHVLSQGKARLLSPVSWRRGKCSSGMDGHSLCRRRPADPAGRAFPQQESQRGSQASGGLAVCDHPLLPEGEDIWHREPELLIPAEGGSEKGLDVHREIEAGPQDVV